jgi:hypothetical protein
VDQSLIAAGGLSALADGAADPEKGFLLIRGYIEAIACAVCFLNDIDSGYSLIVF